MSEMIIQRESLVAIADAIREATGETKPYSLDEMHRKLSTDFIRQITKDRYWLTYVPEGVTKIGNFVFYNNTKITETSLPEGIISIGDNAFNGCINLALTSLPEGLTKIGFLAFSGCTGLTSIFLPESLTHIGDGAFSYCTGLTEVTFKGTPTFIDESFYKCENLTTINVPWAEGEVEGAPWGATNATINYNYVNEEV